MNFILALWFYYLLRICFLVGYLLNEVHVVFDAFDTSCCSYVHKKFKIQNSKKKKKPFGLGALGLQIISIYFQKNWTRGIGKASNCEKKEKAVKLEKTSTKKKEREVNARIFTKW